MTNPAMTFDELVERARALQPAAAEVSHIVTRASSADQRRPRRLRQPRWRAAAVVLALAIAAPATALAVSALISPEQVAKSLPAGARIFGSTPTCTAVRPDVEYRCTLAKAPSPDPITHLTPRQWWKLLATPPNLGKVKYVSRRYKDSSGQWQIGQFALDLPRIERITRAYRNKVLASFGFTPAQIQAHDEAIDADAAGIGAGRFKGTLEPTIDATHHINGGCRAINADGTRWDCYVGKAAVTQKIVSGIGAYVQGPGVG
jgi:hypothetical protein